MKRPISAVALAAALAVALAACSSPTSQDSSSSSAGVQAKGIPAGPITIGTPLGLTGTYSFADTQVLAGVQIAAQQINASGGILGHKLKIDTLNTDSDLANVANDGIQLISDGAQFLIPTMDYNGGGPAARVANAKDIVSITTSGDTRFGLAGIGPYAFNIYPGSPTEGAVAATYAVKDAHWGQGFMLVDNTLAHPITVCSSFQQTYKALGGDLTGQQTFQNSDQSIATQITAMRQDAGHYKFIMLCSYPPGGISALRQIRAAGITVPIVVDAAFDGTYWFSSMPHETNVYQVSAGALNLTQNENSQQLAVMKAYANEHHGQLPDFATAIFTGYGAVQALAQAIRATKSVNGTVIKNELQTFKDVPLTIANVTWTAACHVPLGQPMDILRVQDEKQYLVDSVTPAYMPKAVC